MIERGRAREAFALQARHAREIAKTSELRARMAAATQAGAAWACDASIYDCTRAADEGVLLVGDAASFIEPLSSAGVKKALLSAWRAAVVANTCLKDSSRAGAARDLYDRRERQVYADCARRSAAFFSEAAAVHRTPFWSARAECAAADDDPDASGEWSDEALARDADVRRAFDVLRAADRRAAARRAGAARSSRWPRSRAARSCCATRSSCRARPRRCDSPPAWICRRSRAWRRADATSPP